jgi:hypothetical protein
MVVSCLGHIRHVCVNLRSSPRSSDLQIHSINRKQNHWLPHTFRKKKVRGSITEMPFYVCDHTSSILRAFHFENIPGTRRILYGYTWSILIINQSWEQAPRRVEMRIVGALSDFAELCPTEDPRGGNHQIVNICPINTETPLQYS